jgi:hypothetical protein
LTSESTRRSLGNRGEELVRDPVRIADVNAVAAAKVVDLPVDEARRRAPRHSGRFRYCQGPVERGFVDQECIVTRTPAGPVIEVEGQVLANAKRDRCARLLPEESYRSGITRGGSCRDGSAVVPASISGVRSHRA